MPKSILVAVDGSDTALKAAETAGEMAAAFSAPLTIVHVLLHDRPRAELARMAEVEHLTRHAAGTLPALENVPGTMGDLLGHPKANQEEARLIAAIGDKVVEFAERRARDAGARDVTGLALVGDYADTILETAEERGADMIVMGTRGLGVLRGVLLGSVSLKVANNAGCSVLLVR